MAEPRDKIIKLRCTAEEYETIQWRSEGHRQLAVWARESLLNPDVDFVRQQRQPDPVDPALLRQLAAVGNNLNQIARACHQEGVAALDRVKIIAALGEISAELKKLREQHL